jgi:hypothetical protein
MTTTLSPLPILSFRDNNGNALVNGQLFTYQAGTQTPAPTYTDSTGATQQSNPIILNARGEAQVWIPPNTAYKYVLQDSFGNTIWTVDQIVNSQLITLYGGVDSGTANAYILNFVANFTSYADGIGIYWVPSNSNTGPSTINVNGLGPINLLTQNGSALPAGVINANQIVGIMLKGGAAQLLFAGAVSIPPGSSTAPSFNFSTDPQTGFYLANPSQIGITLGASKAGTFFEGIANFTVGGISGGVSISCPYTLALNVATVMIPAFSGTSNATTFTLSTTVANLFPPRNQIQWFSLPSARDNAANLYAQVGNIQAQGATITTNALITLYKNGNASGWTASSTKGVGDSTTTSNLDCFPVQWVISVQ